MTSAIRLGIGSYTLTTTFYICGIKVKPQAAAASLNVPLRKRRGVLPDMSWGVSQVHTHTFTLSDTL